MDWKELEKKFEEIGEGNWNIAKLSLDYQAFIRPQKVVFVCVDEQLEKKEFTFGQISEQSNQLAHLLEKLDVQKGERVFIYLPRVIESVISFFGGLKVGAIVGTLFSAFEEQALFDRLENSGAKGVITNKDLFGRIRKIWGKLETLEWVIVVDGEGVDDPRAIPFSKIFSESKEFSAVFCTKDDAAFMLYTSGSTGKPKGIVHKHSALIQQCASFQEVFQVTPSSRYWCSADMGWITGVSYVLLAPIFFGVTSLLYAGRFDAEKWMTLIERFSLSHFYTAPTALRMLRAANLSSSDFDFRSLSVIGSVGEPLNPEVGSWGKQFFGVSIFDTWFQTELGSICIGNSGHFSIKAGSMGKPLKGVQATVLNDEGKDCLDYEKGQLVLRTKMPSMMSAVWGNDEKYQSYFNDGWYYSGDICYRDSDGYFFFSGRADDLINTQGERVGPFEIESALVAHPLVIEAGVIGKPDSLRGEIIKAFVVLDQQVGDQEEFKKELTHFVKAQLGGPFYPREIAFVDSLPKTRSGKIMRRVLKARELGIDPGDLSSIEE